MNKATKTAITVAIISGLSAITAAYVQGCGDKTPTSSATFENSDNVRVMQNNKSEGKMTNGDDNSRTYNTNNKDTTDEY